MVISSRHQELRAERQRLAEFGVSRGDGPPGAAIGEFQRAGRLCVEVTISAASAARRAL
jgi:hypothetical protein